MFELPKDSITKHVNLDGDMIVYLATSNGMDGMDKESIEFASVNKKERDSFITGKGTNKVYYSKSTRVVNYKHTHKQAIAKLDYLQKLVLGVTEPETPKMLTR